MDLSLSCVRVGKSCQGGEKVSDTKKGGLGLTGRGHGQAPFKGESVISLMELIRCRGSFLPGHPS